MDTVKLLEGLSGQHKCVKEKKKQIITNRHESTLHAS